MDRSVARRCLLLAPRGFDAPLELLDGFRRRGVGVREVTDAASAMLALARERFVSLIVLEPDSVAEAGALYRAVKRYHPTVPVWQYRWSGEPRLARYSNGTVAGATKAQAALAPMPEPAPIAPQPTPWPQRRGSMVRGAGANGDASSSVQAGMGFERTGPSARPAGTPARPAGSANGSARPSDEEIRTAAALTDEELAMLLDDPPERRGETA